MDHDNEYDKLTKDAVFTWVRPDTLLPTQTSGFESVLDFIFVTVDSTRWQFESTIIKRKGDFLDDNKKSDHRPVDAVFVHNTVSTGPTIDGNISTQLTRSQIIDRIDELQEELNRFRQIIDNQ